MSSKTFQLSDRILWIDQRNQIISFREVEGFERMEFSSREEKISFAYERGISGYRIQ